MKSLFMNMAFMTLVFMAACSGLKNDPEKSRELTQKIQNKDFTIVVNYADPMRGRHIYLTSEYDLRIKNDSAFAFLPYFGVAYSVPYGGGEGGIKFAEPMTNYTMKPKKKADGWDIRFKVKAKEDDYDISLNIFNNGSALLTVNSYNKDMISFNGEVKDKGK